MKLNILIAPIFCIAFSSYGIATESNDCADIKQDDQRLMCYDQEAIESPQERVSPVDKRMKKEQLANQNLFSITPHRPNYILPIGHNFSADYSQYGPFEDAFKDTEIKFQLSLKFPLANDLPWGSSLTAAYTQQSYWQLYAEESASAPFRETNHEPEIIWSIPLNHDILGFTSKQVSLAFNHQSNGRSEPLSRSWNRLTNEFVFERDRLVLAFKWWWRLEEDRDEDDNPNIEDYMGRVFLGAAYSGVTHDFGLGITNNAHKNNRSGIQFDWMFPLSDKLRGYVQLFSGYGENLIDQENYSNRASIGIALTDWL